VHGELAVLDLPRGAGVVPLHADGMPALLQVTRLVDDQHRLRVAETVTDELTDVGTYRSVVPPHPGSADLASRRAKIPGMLGDRPAVLGWERREQPKYEVPHPATRLRPPKTRPDGQHQVVE
jgi:hypothetical protein